MPLRDLFAEHLTRCVVARFICEAVLRFLSLRDFSCGAVLRVASLRDFSCGAISRIASLRGFSCVAVSGVVSLRDFSAERFHALCHCEIFLRSGLVLCVVARFICVAVSRGFVVAKFFSRSDLTRCVVARFFCVAVSRSVSLRDFSCVAVLHVVLLRDFFAYHSKTYYLSPIIKYPFAYLSQPF